MYLFEAPQQDAYTYRTYNFGVCSALDYHHITGILYGLRGRGASKRYTNGKAQTKGEKRPQSGAHVCTLHVPRRGTRARGHENRQDFAHGFSTEPLFFCALCFRESVGLPS